MKVGEAIYLHEEELLDQFKYTLNGYNGPLVEVRDSL